MEHSYFQDRLSAYLDNELPLQEKVVVEEHVRGCVECQQLLEEYAKLEQLVTKHGQLADSDYWEKAAQKIDRAIADGGQTEVDHTLTNRRKAGPSWKLLAVAATVIIVGYLGINKDKFLSPETERLLTGTSAARVSVDSGAAIKNQTDSVQSSVKSLAKTSGDTIGSAGKIDQLADSRASDKEKPALRSPKDQRLKASMPESKAMRDSDQNAAMSDEMASLKSEVTKLAQTSGPSLAPSSVPPASKVGEDAKLGQSLSVAANEALEVQFQDTGLGLAHWSMVRDSLLPLAGGGHKSKGVLEPNRAVMSGYSQQSRKQGPTATAESSTDSRLAEACYWIAKLSNQPEEKANAITTLRAIGDRSVAPLKDTIQNWIKEVSTP